MVFCLTRFETAAILVFLWETFGHLQQLVKAVHIQAVLVAPGHRRHSVVLGMDWVVQVQSERADIHAKGNKAF